MLSPYRLSGSGAITGAGLAGARLVGAGALPPVPPLVPVGVGHQHGEHLQQVIITSDNDDDEEENNDDDSDGQQGAQLQFELTSNCLFSAASLIGVLPNLSLLIAAPCLSSHCTCNKIIKCIYPSSGQLTS